MQVPVTIPHDLLALSGLLAPPRAALWALERALASEGLTPATHPPAGGVTTRVYLTPGLMGTLVARGAPIDALGPFITGMIESWASIQRRPHKTPAASPLDGLPTDTLRPAQMQLLSATLPALLAGRLTFAEASTGVGKSWVIALAAEAAVRRGKRVLIAAPTLVVMAQLVAAFTALGLEPPTPMLGRGQFIDPARLKALLENANLLPAEQRDALAAWTGEPLESGSLAPLAAAAGALAWLRDDALALAPDLPIELVRYAQGDVIEAQAAQRGVLATAPVVITTHAMLAVDMRYRGFDRPLVPDTDWLILDEAHLFEDTVARTFSDGISVMSLRLQLRALRDTHAELLRERRVLRAVDRVLEHAADWQRRFDVADASSFLFVNQPGKTMSAEARLVRLALADGASGMLGDMEKIASAGLPGLDLDEAMRALKAAVDGSNPVSLTLSPIRRYPTIHTGSRSVRKPLEALWARHEAAMLVSATLYVETQEHGRSAGFLASRLAIPMARAFEAPPAIAPWVLTTPEVLIPPADQVAPLCPPSMDEDSDSRTSPAERAYYDALAEAVRKVISTAVGGTLVLCTSHQAVTALRSRLKDDAGQRLLASKRGESIGQCRLRFRRMHAEGIRPVWLATGPAWTGLDLKDTVPAAEDTLLTDVVVTRLPLMPPSSLVAIGRRERAGIGDARMELVFMFRQGIGRLVRAEGLPHRRLWICDGRLFVTDARAAHLTQPCRRVLAQYPRTTTW